MSASKAKLGNQLGNDLRINNIIVPLSTS